MREPEIANWQNINSQLAKRKQPTSHSCASRLFYWNSYRNLLYFVFVWASCQILFTLHQKPRTPCVYRHSEGWRVFGHSSPTLHHSSPFSSGWFAIHLSVFRLSFRFWRWRVVKSGWRDKNNSSPLGMPINTGVSGRKVKSEEYFRVELLYFL